MLQWEVTDWHKPVEPNRRCTCTAGTCFSLIDTTRATNFINLIHLFILHSLTSVGCSNGATGAVARLVKYDPKLTDLLQTNASFWYHRKAYYPSHVNGCFERGVHDHSEIYIYYELTRYNRFFIFFPFLKKHACETEYDILKCNLLTYISRHKSKPLIRLQIQTMRAKWYFQTKWQQFFQESTQTGKLQARANTTFKCAKWQTATKYFQQRLQLPFEEPKIARMLAYSKKSGLIINICHPKTRVSLLLKQTAINL